MADRFDKLSKRYKIEEDEKWREHSHDMPALKLKPGYGISVVPAFGGAMLRMNIEKGPINFSIYYDTQDALGIVGKAYWEIFPFVKYGTEQDGTIRAEEDTGRYYTDEFNEMIEAMYKNTEYQEEFREKFPENFI